MPSPWRKRRNVLIPSPVLSETTDSLLSNRAALICSSVAVSLLASLLDLVRSHCSLAAVDSFSLVSLLTDCLDMDIFSFVSFECFRPLIASDVFLMASALHGPFFFPVRNALMSCRVSGDATRPFVAKETLARVSSDRLTPNDELATSQMLNPIVLS